MTAAALARLYRCGELYRLVDIEGVPLPPTTAQIVSRSVRAAIQQDLSIKIETGSLLPTPEARSALGGIVSSQLSSDVALTEAQAQGGQRRVFETVLLSAQRTYLLWRAVVASRITPSYLNFAIKLPAPGRDIDCIVEIIDGQGFRATKVRTRRPEEGEASRDLTLAVQALAMNHFFGQPSGEATVDYLVDTKELQYVRQVVEFDAGMLTAVQERIKIALAAIEAGMFVPTDGKAWWCQTCQLRPVCRYV